MRRAQKGADHAGERVGAHGFGLFRGVVQKGDATIGQALAHEARVARRGAVERAEGGERWGAHLRELFKKLRIARRAVAGMQVGREEAKRAHALRRAQGEPQSGVVRIAARQNREFL